MMILADAAMYVAVLASIGWVPLAVTTNLSINFLKKPGRNARSMRNAGCSSSASASPSARFRSARGEGELAAHAISTYSIPPIRHAVK